MKMVDDHHDLFSESLETQEDWRELLRSVKLCSIIWLRVKCILLLIYISITV